MGSSPTFDRFASPRSLFLALVAAATLMAGCGGIDVDDGITETGALSVTAFDPDDKTEPDPDNGSKIALDFTSDDANDESAAASLREGRPDAPDPTPKPDKDASDDIEENSVGRSEIEDVENDSEVLIARGNYFADIKEGTGLKVRREPAGKRIDSITRDIAVKATGEGTVIDGVTWAQIRPIGDADWDIGWVVFDHLSGGAPDVDPTPTLDPVEGDDNDDNDTNNDKNDNDETEKPQPTATAVPPAPEPTTPPEPEPTATAEPTPTEDPGADGASQEISGLGERFIVTADSDLHAEADPASAVTAVASAGADAIIANNTVYRYGGTTYIQVNVGGTLGWIRANDLQEP